MELLINGKRQQLEDVRTLAQALERLDLTIDQGGIAVALNGEVVPKSQWRTATLQEGDAVEVIHAVQGG
jgi:sulfur carrier protein